MPYPLDIKEEELKNKVGQDFFAAYDTTKIIGNIDFCVADASGTSHLWAEAKKGDSHNIYDSFTQLILTIGRERPFERNLPPPFLGAFDAEKIAFLPYHAIIQVFDANDFNWNVAPSNHASKEFRRIRELVLDTIEKGLIQFKFDEEKEALASFIKNNFKPGAHGVSLIEITKNNFTAIFYRWLAAVKDTIGINWEAATKKGILPADFYLADILSEENITLKDKLYVVLRNSKYEFDRAIDEFLGTFKKMSASFTDGQQAHKRFWNLYKRPPKEEFWDFIIERRDLLVPQDVRERKGSYFTPQKWVELSQKYLADVLGDDWQEDYYIWDCAAGTGNLLTGLIDKYRVWASTLDQSDVEIMKDRVRNGANLLEAHIFQFDFLNDDFNRLPQNLRDVIEDKEKVKKLLVYINPPYAEASNVKQIARTGANKTGVARTKTYDRCQEKIGTGARELYAQFLYRIFTDLPGCKIANFSKLKGLQAPYFKKFRQYFTPRLERLFLMPANTFDNVRGQFPIGFFVWDTKKQETFKKIMADVYNADGKWAGRKMVSSYDDKKLVIEWLRKYYDDINRPIGFLHLQGTDIQHRDYIFISSKLSANAIREKLYTPITPENILPMCVYYAIRRAITPSWLNDREHFLYPQNSWAKDAAFQTDCLVYALFNNIVTAQNGVNHWIPFSEREVNAREAFGSRFMHSYLGAQVRPARSGLLNETSKLEFSAEATELLEAGKKLYAYYHSQPGINVNASIYEIKEHFLGRNEQGRLGVKSSDDGYEELMVEVRACASKVLANIKKKVYVHGFLMP